MTALWAIAAAAVMTIAHVTEVSAQEGAPLVPADRAVERTDPNSRQAHAALLEKTRRGVVDVYFAGDSITRRWGATDYPELLAHWKRAFHGWNAANFAWGGDTTRNMLWRLENGELDGLSPKVIVLLAGTNNIGEALGAGRPVDAGDVADGVAAILRTMRARLPDATVVVMGIFPRNDYPAALDVVADVNRRVAALADDAAVQFLDINDRLAAADGRLAAKYSDDGLHLNVRGYEVWANALSPVLYELLGPPAEEDLAPPPTGDPSASRRPVGE